MDPAARLCDECRQPPHSPKEKLLCCSRCHQAWYHDATCQKRHYHKHHQAVCQFRANRQNPALSLFEGLQVIPTPHVGRAVIATQEFAAQALVLIEPPALFFNARLGYLELFDAFLRLSQKEQAQVLDMQGGPLDSRRQFLVQGEYQSFQHNRRLAAQYLTLENAKHLLSIVNTNAHRFPLEEGGGTVRDHYTGLFPKASLVEHSCHPNCSIVIRQGLLYYIAERKIQPLERISISYQGCIYEQPRHFRQAFLHENKAFWCQCTRCLSWDECNPIACPYCTDGIMFQSGATLKWSCLSCQLVCPETDDKIRDQLAELAAYAAQLESVRGRLQQGDLPRAWMACVELTETAAVTLSPLSYLHMMTYQLVSQAATSLARMWMKQQGMPVTHPNVSSLLSMSGMAMLKRVLWLHRNTQIVQGDLSLEEAVVQSQMPQPDPYPFHVRGATTEQVQSMVAMICDQPLDDQHVLVDQYIVETFQAGQDLILAGQEELALALFLRIEHQLTNCPRLSRHDLKKVQEFMDSKGQHHSFGNFLLD